MEAPEIAVTGHLEQARRVAEMLGVETLDIRWEHADAPGGDEGNIAHVHAGDDLRSFVVEYDFSEASDQEIRRSIIHELLHVAFRHIASVASHVENGAAKAWLTQAIEEDTEALAEALERWMESAT